MHGKPFLLLLISVCVLLLAACREDREEVQETTADTAIESGDVTTDTGKVGPRLMVADDGQYLVDYDGNALYALMDEKSGDAECLDECLGHWPPLAVTNGLSLPDEPGVRTEMIDTRSRPDGIVQVTYNGHPLYYFAEEMGPDEDVVLVVEDRWGMWHVVMADGSLAPSEM